MPDERARAPRPERYDPVRHGHRPAAWDALPGWLRARDLDGFDRATFSVGRESLKIGEGTTVAVYSAERTIVDCFRLMHQEGNDVAHEVLRRWLRRRGSSPSSLLQVASSFPKAEPRLRHALEVLL